jgi:hypothetical protein
LVAAISTTFWTTSFVAQLVTRACIELPAATRSKSREWLHSAEKLRFFPVGRTFEQDSFLIQIGKQNSVQYAMLML